MGTCPEACLHEVFQGRWDGRWASALPLGQPSSQGPRSGRAWRPGVVRLVGVCGSLWARTSPMYLPLLLSLVGEVHVLASPAAIWAPGASEIGASIRIAREALPATLTACS